MRAFTKALAFSGLCLALAGCNTSDALIPQESIGAASPPVTQAELNRMATAPQPEAAPPGQTAYQQPLPPPQNTLEAQAQALAAGAAVSPAASGPMPGAVAGGEAPPAATAGEVAALPPQSGNAAGTIRFLPIIGAPVQAVTPLSRQLGAEARQNGLTIKGSGDAGADHILKGYLSAFADSGQVTVVYVWDVLDGAGVRLHRIQGQESVPARGADPWAAVPPETMQAIGAKTISGYRDWLRSHSG